MKAFYAIFLLVFLASCGTSVDTNESSSQTGSETEVNVNQETDAQDSEETNDSNGPDSDNAEDQDDSQSSSVDAEVSSDIDAELGSLDSSADNEVTTLQAPYSNPKTRVDMEISYAVNENDVITALDVSASSFDISDFNAAAQKLVGQDISQAEELYVAGSSLTSDAFTAAIKNR